MGEELISYTIMLFELLPIISSLVL